MALLQRTLAALRSGVLASVRIPPSFAAAQQVGAPTALQALRGFADASFLNKDEVTQRVLDVVKNFEKVEASKARACGGGDGGVGGGGGGRRGRGGR